MQKTCPNCHASIAENSNICPFCQFSFDIDEDFADTIEIPVINNKTIDRDDNVKIYKEENTFEEDLNENTEDFDKTVIRPTSQETQEEKTKNGRFSFGKNKKAKSDSDFDGPSRRNANANQNFLSGYFNYLVSYLKHPLQKPDFNLVNNRSNYGITSLLVLAVGNAISFTFLANYFVTHYEWFADLSVLPNLDFNFVAWRFGLKTFVFLLISLWILPILSHFIREKLTKEKIPNSAWLDHYYGMNSFTVVIAFICFLISLLAPLIFTIIVLLIVLLQIALLLITLTMALMQGKVTNQSKLFYSILASLTVFFVLEIFLVGLVY